LAGVESIAKPPEPPLIFATAAPKLAYIILASFFE